MSNKVTYAQVQEAVKKLRENDLYKSPFGIDPIIKIPVEEYEKAVKELGENNE